MPKKELYQRINARLRSTDRNTKKGKAASNALALDELKDMMNS